jgi:hypothetical protein
MTGSSYIGAGGNNGDPEFVNVLPAKQFLSSYVFFADPTYPETNLVIVRAKGDAGFADVVLDCAGAISGFQPLGSSGAYEFARFDLQNGGMPNGNCSTGVHAIHSSAPFGVTVWGWANVVSYAYPAGAGVKPINIVLVPPSPM